MLLYPYAVYVKDEKGKKLDYVNKYHVYSPITSSEIDRVLSAWLQAGNAITICPTRKAKGFDTIKYNKDFTNSMYIPARYRAWDEISTEYIE